MLFQASEQRDHPKEVSLIVCMHLTVLHYKCVSNVASHITIMIFHRHRMLLEECQLTPHDCLAVLRAAKKDFLTVIKKVYPKESATLELTECAFVMYYLQAVVILKHLQRPGVVKHMTVLLYSFCLH